MKKRKYRNRSNGDMAPMNYYVFHGPTDRLSDPYPNADEAIKGAKSLGSRNSKFKAVITFSGYPLFMSGNGDWRILPENYVISVRNVGSRKY